MSICIVGLGNPGQKYTHNRHNAGFLVLDAFAQQHQVLFQAHDEYKGEVASLPAAGSTPRVDLLKPTTFMNASGEAVRALVQFYKVDPNNLWVVHDDLDLPFGTLKLQRDISAAGHNGIRSIISELHRQDFWRFRFGVGRPAAELDRNHDGTIDAAERTIAQYEGGDYVLADFNPDQAQQLPALIQQMCERLQAALDANDPANAANRFNGQAQQQNTQPVAG